ncbi:hypothetical protein HK102_013382 [Quaeritorhiza haematococci]|nr:hypothetical protein HK102_013382 [Quaeritorhiza haematococci]
MPFVSLHDYCSKAFSLANTSRTTVASRGSVAFKSTVITIEVPTSKTAVEKTCPTLTLKVTIETPLDSPGDVAAQYNPQMSIAHTTITPLGPITVKCTSTSGELSHGEEAEKVPQEQFKTSEACSGCNAGSAEDQNVRMVQEPPPQVNFIGTAAEIQRDVEKVEAYLDRHGHRQIHPFSRPSKLLPDVITQIADADLQTCRNSKGKPASSIVVKYVTIAPRRKVELYLGPDLKLEHWQELGLK